MNLVLSSPYAAAQGQRQVSWGLEGSTEGISVQPASAVTVATSLAFAGTVHADIAPALSTLATSAATLGRTARKNGRKRRNEIILCDCLVNEPRERAPPSPKPNDRPIQNTHHARNHPPRTPSSASPSSPRPPRTTKSPPLRPPLPSTTPHCMPEEPRDPGVQLEARQTLRSHPG